jgi:hypothetical protein
VFGARNLFGSEKMEMIFRIQNLENYIENYAWIGTDSRLSKTYGFDYARAAALFVSK